MYFTRCKGEGTEVRAAAALLTAANGYNARQT